MFDWRRAFGPARRGLAPEAKTSAVGAILAMHHVGRPVWTPRDYESLTRAGFGRNPVAYRCVRMLAEAAASAPLVVFEGGARADGHPLQAVLDRPNPEQSGRELFEQLYGQLQTAGNAYLEAAGVEGVEELYALRPDRVRVVPGADGWPAAYDYSAGGRGG